MNDKHFEEIVTEYVETNERNKERILRKFREKQEEKMPKRSVFSKFMIAVGACAIAAIVSLSVYLPLKFGAGGIHRVDDTRTELEYKVAFADDISSLEYMSEDTITSPSGPRRKDKHTNEKLKNEKFKIDSYEEFMLTSDSFPFMYTFITYGSSKSCNVKEIKEEYETYDESFFETHSLLVVFSEGTEYDRGQVSGLSKTSDRIIMTVSRPKYSVGRELDECLKEITYKDLERRCISKGLDFDEFISVFEIILPADEPQPYVYIIELNKRDVQNIDTIDVEVKYSDGLIFADNAARDGLISQEDLNNVNYYLNLASEEAEHGVRVEVPADFIPTPKDPAELDEETMKKVTDVARRCSKESAWLENIVLRNYAEKYEIEYIYLGEYNGYVAIAFQLNIKVNKFVVNINTDVVFGAFLWKDEE